MSGRAIEMINPFGEESCEAEKNRFRESYSELYFFAAPFNDVFLELPRYLIIGRRGTGKTSLAQFLSFQDLIPNAKCIYANQPEIYTAVLNRLADQPDQPNEVAIPRTRKVWEYLIWTLLFHEYGLVNNVPSPPRVHGDARPSSLIRSTVEHLVASFLDDDGSCAPGLEDFLAVEPSEELKGEVLRLAKHSPALIAIDSLEHYSTDDPAMMRSVSALISAASEFNVKHSHDGIHVKVFLSGEVFPYLLENVVENPGKHVKSPLWLHWRPKDLIRLVCWRFHHYLVQNGQIDSSKVRIDWSRFSSVKEAIWTPFFGVTIANRIGILEESFAYVLRHTQMRPRQMVYLCNQIALGAQRAGTSPHFTAETIRESIHGSQSELAADVLNAYASRYPNVAGIVNALSGLPKIFRGSELDRVAPRTASEWQHERYSPLRFRKVVAELGIVGRVRKFDAGFAEADFEYSQDTPLYLQSDDLCAVHPMFYRRLNIVNDVKAVVYPFPDHHEFSEVRPKSGS